MNLTDTYEPGFNFFSKFQYPDWVHDDFLGKHPPVSELDEYETLLVNFGENDAIGDAFAICWQQLEAVRVDYKAKLDQLRRMVETLEDPLYRGIITDSQLSDIKSKVEMSICEVSSSWPQKQEHSIQLLSNLVSENWPDIPIDSYVLDTQAIVYTHLAIALALRLERLDNGHTERFWELLEDALRVIKMSRTSSISLWSESSSTLEVTIKTSMKLLEVLVYSYLFQKYFDDAEYDQALQCLSFAITQSELCDQNINETLGVDWQWPSILEWAGNQSGNDPAIECFGVGYHLVGLIVPMQSAAYAFDEIWRENPSNTNWETLSTYCERFADFCRADYVPDTNPEEFQVFSTVVSETLDADHFWGIAKVLASQRISPSELIEYQEQMREKESETRLRLYFFPEQWNSLPEKARASLISADREYENHRGRRPVIFDHLRHAARAIMVESLWKPYREFLRGKAADGIKDISDLQKVRQIIEDDQYEPDLAPLVKSPYFDEFLGTISEDTKFVRRLPEKLLDLNEWANKVSHEHHWGYKGFEGQIRETYAEFLGIGRNGILPRLMRLHPKANVNSRNRI